MGGASSATEGTISNFDTLVPGPNNGTVSRLYTLTDACSQTATCIQTLPVQDTTPPNVVCQPATKTLNGTDTQVVVAPLDVFASGTDNCGGLVTPVSVVPNTFYCAGTYSVTLTATDGNGNNNTCGATVTVIDNRAAPGVVYVDDNYVGLPSGTPVAWPNGVGPLSHMIDCDAFATIQGGVNRVAPSGTVNVAVGTYPESQVLIVQACTVLGQGAATTAIDAGCGTGLLLPGTVRITAPGNVTFDGFTVKNPKSETVSGNNVRVGIFASSPSPGNIYTITHNTILGCNNPADAQDYGFYAYAGQESVVFQNNEIHLVSANPVLIERHPGPTDVSYNTFDRGVGDFSNDAYFNMNYGGANVTSLQTVNHNTIDMGNAGAFDNAHRGFGVTFAGSYNGTDQGGYTQVVITENQINNLRGYRWGIGLWNNAQAGNAAWGDITGAVIERNVLTGPATPEAGSIGIRLLGPASSATVMNNTISGLDESFQARNWNDPVASDTVIFDNSFANIATGFENQGASALNASGNWWGGNIEAGITAQLIGPADYTPWLDAGTDTDLITMGFQGDFSTLWVSAASPQTGSTGRIQEGIDLIADGSLTGGNRVVNVLAGSYGESPSVNKALKLLGAQANVTPVAGGRPGGESVVNGEIHIYADNVVVNGFEVPNQYNSIVADVNFVALHQNVEISYNYVHSSGGAWTGIVLMEDTQNSPPNTTFQNFTVSHNYVAVNGSPSTALGAICLSGSTGATYDGLTISDNDLSNPTGYGIFCGAVSGDLPDPQSGDHGQQHSRHPNHGHKHGQHGEREYQLQHVRPHGRLRRLRERLGWHYREQRVPELVSASGCLGRGSFLGARP